MSKNNHNLVPLFGHRQLTERREFILEILIFLKIRMNTNLLKNLFHFPIFEEQNPDKVPFERLLPWRVLIPLWGPFIITGRSKRDWTSFESTSPVSTSEKKIGILQQWRRQRS